MRFQSESGLSSKAPPFKWSCNLKLLDYSEYCSGNRKSRTRNSNNNNNEEETGGEGQGRAAVPVILPSRVQVSVFRDEWRTDVQESESGGSS